MKRSFFQAAYTAIWMHYLDANKTSNEGNTPRGTNYTVTYFPSRKLSKLDEPEM